MNKRVTIVEVAERAGVAVSSASNALNGNPGVSEATRSRVRAAADALGYVPSLRGKSLQAKRAFCVGLVVERDVAVLEADPFFGAFISGIERELAPREYALVLQVSGSAEESRRRYEQLAADRRVDGVFLNELRVDDPRIALLRELGLPAVGVNAAREGFPFPFVRQDGAAGVSDLVFHLASLGHRRIAHVSGPAEFLHARERVDAWRSALLRSGLEVGPLCEGDFTYDGGRVAADELLGLQRPPTAVVCANDLTAIGLMNRVQELGVRVPDELSVAGYDGIRFGDYVRPALTTVQTAPSHLGQEAARLLLDAIEGEVGADERFVENASLVIRASTGPAPAR
ncbi:LacI family DNA-binding transcriptional regulator [Streptomyces aculeolatus]